MSLSSLFSSFLLLFRLLFSLFLSSFSVSVSVSVCLSLSLFLFLSSSFSFFLFYSILDANCPIPMESLATKQTGFPSEEDGLSPRRRRTLRRRGLLTRRQAATACRRVITLQMYSFSGIFDEFLNEATVGERSLDHDLHRSNAHACTTGTSTIVRVCATTLKTKKEPSICQSLPCLDLVSFLVLNRTGPQAPLLEVPFRQSLHVSDL